MVLIAIEEHWNHAAADRGRQGAAGRARTTPAWPSTRWATTSSASTTSATPGSPRWTSRASTWRSCPWRRPGRSRSTRRTPYALSRDANDVAAEAVRRHPTRLRAFATLPLADPAAAVAELERAAALGFVGTMVYGRVGERPARRPALRRRLRRGRGARGCRSSSTRRSRPPAVREAQYTRLRPDDRPRAGDLRLGLAPRGRARRAAADRARHLRPPPGPAARARALGRAAALLARPHRQPVPGRRAGADGVGLRPHERPRHVARGCSARRCCTTRWRSRRPTGCCSRPTTRSSGRPGTTSTRSSPSSPATTSASSSPRATRGPSSGSAGNVSRRQLGGRGADLLA